MTKSSLNQAGFQIQRQRHGGVRVGVGDRESVVGLEPDEVGQAQHEVAPFDADQAIDPVQHSLARGGLDEAGAD